MTAGVFAFGLLTANVVEDFEEVVLGFYGITLETLHVYRTVVVVFGVEVVGVGTRHSFHQAPHLLPRGGETAIPYQQVNVGWEEGVGIDFAIAFVLKVIENVGVELGILFIGEEGEIGDGSHQDVIDAGGGFYSCFSCHIFGCEVIWL